MKIQSIILSIFLLLALHNESYGQGNKQYIDSVNKYIKYIDSIIVEFSVNPVSEINITKTGTHFSNIEKGTHCGGAELYKSGENLYRLSYSDNCDSVFKLQDYYFDNNKIVFVRTVQSQNRNEAIDQYYFNDEIINPVAGKLYLEEGYEVIKKMSN